MNPYLVPGMEGRPLAPLCPFQVDEHEDYYVPVDHCQQAFEEFQELIGDVAAQGGLVVTTGQRGCGKTSLINRCANWLSGQLDKAQIISLVDESSPTDPIEYRLRHVFSCVLDDVRSRQLLDADQLKGLEDRTDNLELGYRQLSSLLDPGTVLIILLPHSEDLTKEIAHYARFTRPRLVFFAESSYPDNVDRRWKDIAEACRVTPLLLRVGPLSEGDGWRFARARQERSELHPDAGVYRRVSEETMQRVTALPMSIGQLQNLLHGVYEEQRRDPPADDALELSYEEITDYFFRRSMDAGGQGSTL